jgi:hypothetical protein
LDAGRCEETAMFVHEFRISNQEKVFCEEYVVDFNATQAAKRAGYSRKSAYSIGNEKLENPEIERYVCYLMAQRSLRTGITADRVLEELAKIAFARDGVAARDKLKALDILAKHVGLFNKKGFEYTEFFKPDVKVRSYLNAIFHEESEARAVFNLLHPYDRRLIKSKFEDWLQELAIEPEPEEPVEPDGTTENGLEPDENDEDVERDSHLIKFMKELMGEETIKRQVLARLDYLFSDGPDTWEHVADSKFYEITSRNIPILSPEVSHSVTPQELEEAVASDPPPSNVVDKRCPNCGMILCFKSGRTICLNCKYSE